MSIAAWFFSRQVLCYKWNYLVNILHDLLHVRCIMGERQVCANDRHLAIPKIIIGYYFTIKYVNKLHIFALWCAAESLYNPWFDISLANVKVIWGNHLNEKKTKFTTLFPIYAEDPVDSFHLYKIKTKPANNNRWLYKSLIRNSHVYVLV